MANMWIIRDLCRNKKITLKELSKKAGITEHGLQGILKSNTTKIDTLEKIASVLNVSPNIFFDNKYKNNKESGFVQLVTGLDRDFLITLSNRYDSYLDKISFFKDYYVWEIIVFVLESDPILGKGIPAFTFRYKDSPEFLITPGQAYELKTLIEFEPYNYLPYSKMPSTRQGFIKKTNILLGFYFLMFRDNILNISSLLTDGLISDPEIKKYWGKWKSIKPLDPPNTSR